SWWDKALYYTSPVVRTNFLSEHRDFTAVMLYTMTAHNIMAVGRRLGFSAGRMEAVANGIYLRRFGMRLGKGKNILAT
ncbi:MAG TPA: hypothetical protein PKL83_03215, partial [bacterium]|nr:hypothetical protein [bacterium]